MTTIMAVGCSSDQELNHAYDTAAKQGDIATLKTLLQQGVDVDAMDRQHAATALVWAAHEGRIEVASFLLGFQLQYDCLVLACWDYLEYLGERNRCNNVHFMRRSSARLFYFWERPIVVY